MLLEFMCPLMMTNVKYFDNGYDFFGIMALNAIFREH